MANVDPSQPSGNHFSSPAVPPCQTSRYFLRARKPPAGRAANSILNNIQEADQRRARLESKRIQKEKDSSAEKQRLAKMRKRVFGDGEECTKRIALGESDESARQAQVDVPGEKLVKAALPLPQPDEQLFKNPIEMILEPFPWQYAPFQKQVSEFYQRLKELFSSSREVNALFDDALRKVTFFHHERELQAIFDCERVELNQSLTLTRPSMSLTLSGDPSLILSPETRNKFLQREAELYQLADAFFKTSQPQNVSIPKTLYGPQFFPFILQIHNGICIGELHSQIAAKKFLMEQMPALRDAGARILFMEHLFYDSTQKWLDEYFQSPSGAPMPKYLHAYLQYMSSGLASAHVAHERYNYTEIVRLAKELGLRIVGLDTTLSYSCGASDKLGINNRSNRYKAMNYTAVQIIQREARSEKFIAFMGSGHVGTVLGAAGVGPLLRCPTVIIEGNNPGWEHKLVLHLNVKNFRNLVEHVSVVICDDLLQ